jgi:hypothetical protein
MSTPPLPLNLLWNFGYLAFDPYSGPYYGG